MARRGVGYARDEIFKQLLGYAAGDEHEFAAAVFVGPAVQRGGGVEDVLYAVDDQRTITAFKVENALDSQQVRADQHQQHLQQGIDAFR